MSPYGLWGAAYIGRSAIIKMADLSICMQVAYIGRSAILKMADLSICMQVAYIGRSAIFKMADLSICMQVAYIGRSTIFKMADLSICMQVAYIGRSAIFKMADLSICMQVGGGGGLSAIYKIVYWPGGPLNRLDGVMCKTVYIEFECRAEAVLIYVIVSHQWNCPKATRARGKNKQRPPKKTFGVNPADTRNPQIIVSVPASSAFPVHWRRHIGKGVDKLAPQRLLDFPRQT